MKPGDAAIYRSLAGDIWSARIAGIRADGTADIDVITAGEPVRLHARWDERSKKWTKDGL